MRATLHNGRRGKNGVYSAKHNDRNFDTGEADHIHEEKMSGNRYWHCFQKKEPELTFEQAEQKFYEKHFTKTLEARNEKSVRQRHAERVQTIEQYRQSAKSCPEETIIQIGKRQKDGSLVTADSDTLWNVAVELINWEMKTFPNVKLLNVALHVDEEGAPHIHQRKVWIANDEEEREIVGQAKALEEMGIERPDMSKKAGRYNNAKQTYSQKLREKYLEIAKEHGLEIEIEPEEKSKSGLAQDEYKARQEKEKAEEAKRLAEDYEKAAHEWSAKAQFQKHEADEAEKQARILTENARILTDNARKEAETIKSTTEPLKAEYEAVKGQIEGLRDKRDELQSEIKTGQKELEKVLDMKARASEIHKVFGDKETQTYHRNMLESTRAIGREARQHMEEAKAYHDTADKTMKQAKELQKEVQPMHDKAQKELAKAREYREDLEGYIMETAQNLVKKELEKHSDLSDEAQRMKEKMQSVKYKDGHSVWDEFQQEEKARRKEIERKMMAEAEKIAKQAEYDWDDYVYS